MTLQSFQKKDSITTKSHPVTRANREAERFMKTLNKTEQITNLQCKDTTTAIQDMLIRYRSTSHPATGVTPYEALMNRQVRTKLDHYPMIEVYKMQCDEELNKRDKEYKEKIKKIQGKQEH